MLCVLHVKLPIFFWLKRISLVSFPKVLLPHFFSASYREETHSTILGTFAIPRWFDFYIQTHLLSCGLSQEELGKEVFSHLTAPRSCCLSRRRWGIRAAAWGWSDKPSWLPGWEGVSFPHSPALSWSTTPPSASCPRHLSFPAHVLSWFLIVGSVCGSDSPLYFLVLLFLCPSQPPGLQCYYPALLELSSCLISCISQPCPPPHLPHSVPSHCFHRLCHKHSCICYNIFVILVIEWDINRWLVKKIMFICTMKYYIAVKRIKKLFFQWLEMISKLYW